MVAELAKNQENKHHDLSSWSCFIIQCRHKHYIWKICCNIQIIKYGKVNITMYIYLSKFNNLKSLSCPLATMSLKFKTLCILIYQLISKQKLTFNDRIVKSVVIQVTVEINNLIKL